MAEADGKSGEGRGKEFLRLGEVETRPFRFVVAVDGSELAHHSFLTALGFVKKKDTIDVIHVADPTKGKGGDLREAAFTHRIVLPTPLSCGVRRPIFANL